MHLDKIPPLDAPCALTIGTFDGVHLGHQMLLDRLKSVLPPNGMPIVFTFSSHPSHLFTPSSPIPLICTPEHKSQLLTSYGAKLVLMVPFTQSFSETPFATFLTELHSRLHFTHLILGEGATFGKNREGDETQVGALGKKLRFQTTYITKKFLGTRPISSGRVRIAIETGNFEEAALCLGREYSLLVHLHPEKEHYVVPLKNICLPPEGIYPVRIKTANETLLGRAHVNPRQQFIRIDPQSPLPSSLLVEIIF